MEKSSLGLIGCGAMGSALARGFVEKGGINPRQLLLYDADHVKRDELASSLGAIPVTGVADISPACRFVFLAVKPADMAKLLVSLRSLASPGQIYSSTAAGITIAFMQDRLGPENKIIRLMPNTPCLIGAGTIAISAGSKVSEEEIRQVEKLLQPMGLTLPLPEKMLDAATGLSGSGPAYIYLFMESLIDAGVLVGLPRETATAMVMQNVIGSALMLREQRDHPAALRNNVTSPAGTTAEALAILEENAFRGTILKAVREATRRAKELSHE